MSNENKNFESEWVKVQVVEVNRDEFNSLVNLLENTTDVMKQLLGGKNSKACVVLAESCIKCNDLLIKTLLENEKQ